MRPDPANSEILVALDLVMAERCAAGSLNTAGSSHASPAEDNIDSRRIENALRQLARYREELKQNPVPLPAAASKPRAIGRFQILRELGRGGCGVVFLARDPELNRLFALKVPHPAALVSPELQRRFLIEARAAAGLEHPGIIRVYEVGNTGPISWIASEYCAGVTLQLYLERRQTNLSPRAAAQLIRQLALAINYAHQHGILHRDLKPANVLLEGEFGDPDTAKSRDLPPLEECEPKLTDFGLAKILNETQDATQTHIPMGTPAYMSPEQIAGQGNQIHIASDVYSLGMILYEMLAGVPAFRGSTRTETWRQVLQDDPKPLSLYRADMPRDLQAIVRRATEKKPADRYQSAADLAADLQRFLVGEPTLARPLGATARAIRWARRHPTVTGMISVLAAAVLLLFAGGYWHLHKIEDELRINRELRATGEKQLEELRHIAHLRNLQLADAGLAEAKLNSAVKSLQASVPQANEQDQRDFVWWHLWRRCHHEKFQVEHQNTVSALAFSPDGKLLASGDHQSNILITELATQKILHKLVGHQGNINALAFHGSQLLSAADDGKVMQWDPARGECLGEFKCHDGDILCLAVHPSQPWFATGGVDGAVRIWQLHTKEQLHEFRGENPWIRGVAFSPDGKSLLATGHEELVRCWDIESGQLRWHSERVNSKLHALAINAPADTVFVGGQTGVLYEYRISNGELVDKIITDLTWIRALNTCVKQQHLAVCANSGRVKIYRMDKPSTTAPEFDFAAHDQPIWSIALSPQGECFATGGVDARVKVWHNDTDRALGYCSWKLGEFHGNRDIRVDFKSGALLVIGADGWIATNLRQFGSKDFSFHEVPFLEHAAVDARFRSAALFPANQPVLIRTGLEGPEQLQKELSITPTGEEQIHWHPDGQTLGIFGPESRLRLWNVNDDRLSKEFTLASGNSCRKLTFSPDGNYAVLHFNSPREIQLLDLRTGEVLWKILSNKARPYFSADSQLLVAGFSEETIKVYDLEQRREIASYAGKVRELNTLAITPDKRYVAAGYMDGTLQFWDLRTGTRVIEIPISGGAPEAIFFSPDLRQMLVAVERHSKIKLCYFADFRIPYPH